MRRQILVDGLRTEWNTAVQLCRRTFFRVTYCGVIHYYRYTVVYSTANEGEQKFVFYSYANNMMVSFFNKVFHVDC